MDVLENTAQSTFSDRVLPCTRAFFPYDPGFLCGEDSINDEGIPIQDKIDAPE